MSVKNAELENEMRELMKNQEHLNSFVLSSPSLPTSSPSSLLNAPESSSDDNDVSSSSGCSSSTGSPHIRLEQTTFGVFCVLCRPIFTTRAERAVC